MNDLNTLNFYKYVDTAIKSNHLSHAYLIEVSNYNEDYKLVAESKQIHEINSSDYTKFKQIQNYSTINYGYTVEDIKYYTFKIIETNVKVTNNNITNISNKYKYKDYVNTCTMSLLR